MNATNAEMIAAVEQWARSKGWHRGHGDAPKQAWSGDRPYCIACVSWSSRVDVWAKAKYNAPLHSITAHAALVWALTEATLGSCKACHGRGTRDEWQQQIIRGLHADESMPETVARAQAIGATYSAEWTWEVLCGYRYSRPLTLVASRSHPCPACLGLGNAGQRLLDAQPRLTEHSYSTPQQRAWSHTEPGDPTSIAALTVLADQLQARGEPLGLYLAHLLAVMRGEAIEDACTSEAVEALRRLTPAPRPGERLLTSLSIEGEVLRVSYRSEPHGSGLGYRTLLALPPCIVDIGDPVRQRVLLHFAAATTLYDLAQQIESQTYGLVTYIDEATRCVNVHERSLHMAFDGLIAQVATFNADTSSALEIVAWVNASIEGMSARAGERGEIVLAADQARGAEASHVPLGRAERLRPSERERRRRQRGRDLAEHHRRDRAPRFGLRGEG